MTNDTLVPYALTRARWARWLALAALLVVVVMATGRALAQAEDIVFEVEILRVDLVRDDDGERAERLVPVQEAIPGEVIEYRVTAVNEGDIIYRPGTVVVSLPIGEGFAYVEDSATPSSERVVTEFSADGGSSFSEPPVLVGRSVSDDTDDGEGANGEGQDGDGEENEGESGEDGRRRADPAEYDAIRWTFSIPFEPGQEEVLVYRVEVR